MGGDAYPYYLIGYYGHNLHFLAIANAFAGNYGDAIAAANKLHAVESPRIKEAPYVDGFLMTPALLLAQFRKWDEILALPEPAFEAPITVTMWHFARTLALAAKGRADDAKTERAKFVESAATLSKSMEYGNNDAAALAAVARPYLDGRLALMAGNSEDAVRFLREAVAAEDLLAYDEPPGWYLPARDALGAALLRAGDLAGAENVFRDELAHHPESGRALFGLQAVLEAQGRASDAADVQQRFRRAWRAADTGLDIATM
jgi:tetratricopeptide (TPR) repeat protein